MGGFVLDVRPEVPSQSETGSTVKLAAEPHRVFTKEELLREVWDFRSLGSKRCSRSTSRLLVGVCTVGPPL
jgi:DNA-binding response OmpR family regulator